MTIPSQTFFYDTYGNIIARIIGKQKGEPSTYGKILAIYMKEHHMKMDFSDIPNQYQLHLKPFGRIIPTIIPLTYQEDQEYWYQYHVYQNGCIHISRYDADEDDFKTRFFTDFHECISYCETYEEEPSCPDQKHEHIYPVPNQ